jgi:anti-sigma regulatory factor (Ser/Thr protein kinase)/putative methionine-R-sulfoxide reductase with GAF domain
MTGEHPEADRPPIPPRAGQIVLSPGAAQPPSEQVRALHGLSDPALSELGLEEFLDELLIRVRDSLTVDTVAILLLDAETQELVARAAKGIEEEVEQRVRIPIGRGFAGRIAAERVAIFIEAVEDADILNPILREKGIRSLLGVPLIVEGELIGVLHVGSLRPRRFHERDLAVLQVAAARAAPGIERARLSTALEHEHRVAMLLQRSLLPKRLVDTVGIAVAARYVPATDEVGGDWYDVFELGRGQVGVAIGDVVGHGVKAAALMGQLRTALHAYAIENHGPAQTLELVDRFVQAMPDYAMATAAYAVLDPATGSLRISSSGHLPPIVVGEGGARVVEVVPAAPLGAFPYGSSQEHELLLAAGETLVLYTDGLVERPGVPLGDGIDELVATVSEASDPDEVCRLAIDQMAPPGGRRDDVAVVAVQNLEVPEDLRLRLAARPTMLAQVRTVLRRWLVRMQIGGQDASEIILAVNEACANAVEHAYSPAPAEFELKAIKHDGEVMFVITDTGRWRGPRGSNRGRGLAIMNAAMDEVDLSSSLDGTEVTMRKKVAG